MKNNEPKRQRRAPDPEVKVIASMCAYFEQLDAEAKQRALRYFVSRYGMGLELSPPSRSWDIPVEKSDIDHKPITRDVGDLSMFPHRCGFCNQPVIEGANYCGESCEHRHLSGEVAVRAFDAESGVAIPIAKR